MPASYSPGQDVARFNAPGDPDCGAGSQVQLHQFVVAFLRLEFQAFVAFEMDDGGGANKFLANH